MNTVYPIKSEKSAMDIITDLTAFKTVLFPHQHGVDNNEIIKINIATNNILICSQTCLKSYEPDTRQLR
jgi:hypothetical protein